MSGIAIRVDKVSKKFSRSLRHTMLYGTTDLTKIFFGFEKESRELRKGEFWALDNVSFTVKKGEAVGLVGGNGAGKSTLLKMINGIFMPDKGSITVEGRVGALIEVGAGFHPMLTGRENIYVNGSILGMSKAEIDRQLEAIIYFSGIEEFIDTPVKFYSSGMYVRLGFAVAAHSRPEILLIDEVLAVGDARFQRKCLDYLTRLRKEGVTFILVSHNLQSIEGISSTGILFDKGKMIEYGDPGKVISQYEKMMRVGVSQNYSDEVSEADKYSLRLVKRYMDYGGNEIKVESIRLLNSDYIPRIEFNSDEMLVIEVVLNAYEPIQRVKLWTSFINELDMVCLGAREDTYLLQGRQILRLTFNPIQLTTGKYKLAFHIFDETFTSPYSNGHYGFFEVTKNMPTLNPGTSSPLCWKNVTVERL